ncbi:hypothetical protein, partial [Segatella copri]|uniref:hypothetical protein n=1 Tax=Segatella copri TaxID=165179 RepID=UPI0022E084FF
WILLCQRIVHFLWHIEYNNPQGTITLILPSYITYTARLLHRPPLESVVAKQSFAVRPAPLAASRTFTLVSTPKHPTAVP